VLFESLELRRLLSGQPVADLVADTSQLAAATYGLSGGTANLKFDALGRASLSATSTQLATSSASTTSSAPAPLSLDGRGVGGEGADPSATWSTLPMPSVVEINGKDLINDTLSLDLSIVPPTLRTIIYNGGAGGYDTLIVHGGTFKSEVYTATGRDSGIVSYYSSDDPHIAPLTVIFSGLEPVIDGSSASYLTINATSGDDNITIDDAGTIAGDDAIIVQEANSNFESYTFANKTFVTVDGMSGNDSLAWNATRPAAGLAYITLAGGDGNDSLYAGPLSGAILAGGPGDDAYVFDPARIGAGSVSVTVTENTSEGTDTLDFSAYSTNLTVDLSTSDPQTVDAGSNLSLTLTNANPGGAVVTEVENVIAGSGNDVLTGSGAADNTLNGGDGNDTLIAGSGNDTLIGGAGNDTYVLDPNATVGNDTIVETANADTDTLDFSSFTIAQPITVDLSDTSQQTVADGVLNLTLSTYDSGIENVIGGAGDDTLTGNSRDNILTGGAGSDTYVVTSTSGGSDTINESPGVDSDTLDFSAVTSAVTVDLSSTSAQTVFTGQTITLSNSTAIENVIGGSGNDTISGNSSDNYIDGGAGDNTISGGDGNDTLIAGNGGNTIYAGGGENTIALGDGGNSVTTGEGDNSISAGDGNNTITAGGGANTIAIGDGDNHITVGDGNNSVTVGDGANHVIGGDGDNEILAGNGGNVIQLGNGSSYIDVGSGTNSITVGNGSNTIWAGLSSVGSGSIAVGTGDNIITTEGDPNAGQYNGYAITTGDPAGNNVINDVPTSPEFANEIELTRHLESSGTRAGIAGYQVLWNDFTLSKSVSTAVVLIQEITVEGSDDRGDTFTPVQYYEVVGVIPAGQTVLHTIDDWRYADRQSPPGQPRIGWETVMQTGKVTAYEYTDELRTLIKGWNGFVGPFKAGGSPWTSGGWRASTSFTPSAYHAIVTEVDAHRAFSEWVNGFGNKLYLDGDIP
jgi:Ca2+-binding RTX toxin-like protein